MSERMITAILRTQRGRSQGQNQDPSLGRGRTQEVGQGRDHTDEGPSRTTQKGGRTKEKSREKTRRGKRAWTPSWSTSEGNQKVAGFDFALGNPTEEVPKRLVRESVRS